MKDRLFSSCPLQRVHYSAGQVAWCGRIGNYRFFILPAPPPPPNLKGTPTRDFRPLVWHRCDMHTGIIDTAVTSIAVSLTPLCNQPLSNIFANSKLYSKSLWPVYQGPRRCCLMKKTRGRKSRVRVPLISSSKGVCILPLDIYLLWGLITPSQLIYFFNISKKN
jgi:hypothetical protein